MLLNNIRVLDFSKVFAGPHGAAQLALLGADVIKVEMPGLGDDTRAAVPKMAPGSVSANFMNCNTCKRSLSVDMKRPEAKEIISRLVASADVIVENMRTGVMDRLGFGYEDCKKLRPDIIYCSVSGYGRTGPYCMKGGYDILAQAQYGMMSVTGPAGGDPCKVSTTIVDFGSSSCVLNSVLAALLHRRKTGEGQWISLTLMGTAMNFASYMPTLYKATGKLPPRMGTKSPLAAPYQMFHAKDGRLTLAVLTEKEWEGFKAVPFFQDFANKPEYATNKLRLENVDALEADIANAIGTRTKSLVLSTLRRFGVPCSAVEDLSDLMNDPTMFDATMEYVVQPIVGPMGTPKPSYTFYNDNMRLKERFAAPNDIGQHTDEVLTELGFDAAAIADYRENKII